MNFKKVMIGLLAGSLSLGMLAGCGSSTSTQTAGNKDAVKVGIVQYADHPSLDNCREGFKAGMKEGGFEEGKNVEYVIQSAKGDDAVDTQIAQSFVSDKLDLVCGIATPSAIAVYNACYDANIPVIFNAVSDPITAKLAKSKTETMPGITGVSDELPVDAQLKLIREIMPDAKKIGIIYTTSEANSVSTIETYQDKASEYGFEIVAKGIANVAEVAQAADAIVGDVDCISNMTDNTVVSQLGVIIEKATEKKIPVFGSEEEQVGNGCVASAGIDYVKLGEQAGKQAAKVLNGEDITKIPYETMEESKVTVNPDAAAKIALTIPESVTESAEVKTSSTTEGVN